MAPVISKISGYVTEVKVKDNQFVKKGDTLVILDNRDQKMALKQAQAALATAKAISLMQKLPQQLQKI
jgi:membrane fusion protein (multidrug efflux system)